MATHYSILSILIRPEIQEKISLGLLLFDPKQIFFNYSKNKLYAAKALLSEEAYKLLKDSIRNIESRSVDENDLLGSNNSQQLAFKDEMLLNSFSQEYVSYLSKYNNNVLSFSSPKKIDLSANDDIFKKLFSKFVDINERIDSGVPRPKTIEVFKTKNRVRLTRYFNIDKKISSIDIPDLIMPVKVDLLGQNEIPVYVQAIDMERRPYDINNDIAVLLSLRTAFLQNKKDQKGFVIAHEPPKRDKEQHAIWQELKKSHLFEYVDVSEGERVIQYAEEHKVHPLIEDNDADNIQQSADELF